MQKSYQRKSVHSIEEVYNAVKDVLDPNEKGTRIMFDGDNIKGNSQRYQVFFMKGMKCVRCGIEGKFFAKEKDAHARSYHLNLYAIDENGEEVLMTKDHIIPKSKGGPNKLSNYQCMCVRCNVKKGNNKEEE